MELTRRSFLAAIGALPFVGKFIPTPTQFIAPDGCAADPWVPMTICPEEGGGEIFITNGDTGYVTDRRYSVRILSA